MDVEVIVETPQGSRNKYKVDPKSGRIRLDRMLFTSTVYPLDYGEIPGTLAEDGDPLDMLVWLDEPTFPGCLVTVRPVAVFWMADESGPDAKLLGVAAHDLRKSKIRDLGDVPRHLLNEIGHFFDIYKELEPGKSTDVRGWMDRAEAERVIKDAQARTRLAATGPVPGQRTDLPDVQIPARPLCERNAKQPWGSTYRVTVAAHFCAPGSADRRLPSSSPRRFPLGARGLRGGLPPALAGEENLREERGGAMGAVEIPEGSLFGLDNLPYGVFVTGSAAPRVGVRVGDSVVDLAVALRDEVFAAPVLNPFMAEGPARWAAARARLTELITSGDIPAGAVSPVRDLELRLPFEVADYVDFYASEHHASNLGRLFRPKAEPLMPNWKHLPVGYHGRAGTVVVSGTGIVRPTGQRKGPADPVPVFGPSIRLDIEAELGFVIGAGSPLGQPVPAAAFADHVFGAVLVNDWSARDLQAWEYVPLGPHLGKSFATSVSPWVVPLAALQAARVPLPGQDPVPLPYLREAEDWGLDIDLAVEWNGEIVSRPPYRTMYWSPAQMLAHMTVNGASTRTGDLFASGTISGPERAQRGAFIELTWGGSEPVTVKGEPRTFLHDGDTVTITATAPGASGARIGFGEVTATILPARPAGLPADEC